MQRVILRSMAHRLNQILREHAKGASYRGLREVSGREQRDVSGREQRDVSGREQREVTHNLSRKCGIGRFGVKEV